MKRMLMKQNLSIFYVSVLRFIDRSACRAMGCFLDCFRARDHQRSSTNLVSHSSMLNFRNGQNSQNPLSLFLSEEKVASSPCLDKDVVDLDSIHIDKSLRDEARFLKACGTIPETPIEIRKASKKLNTSQHSGPSKFHSWISSNSAMGFHFEESSTPMKAACAEVGRPSFTSEQTPSSCVINPRDNSRISSASIDAGEEVDGTCRPLLAAGNLIGKTKSVRFECDFAQSHSSNSSQDSSSSRKPDLGGKISYTPNSPNPTPLKLSDEMQTPGTIYPSNMESASRGRPRIRSQFVHPVSNLMVHKDSLDLEQAKLVKGSISPWLNQSNEDSNEGITVSSDITPRVAATPGDRPIIGLVAAHWNENDQSQISPKWWDGNGIPNSTTKYKEDQKVSWHATPFEERLEKALSEEFGQDPIPRRLRTLNHIDMKLEVMEEEDEYDSTIPQLQHSMKPNSVVSF